MQPWGNLTVGSQTYYFINNRILGWCMQRLQGRSLHKNQKPPPWGFCANMLIDNHYKLKQPHPKYYFSPADVQLLLYTKRPGRGLIQTYPSCLYTGEIKNPNLLRKKALKLIIVLNI